MLDILMLTPWFPNRPDGWPARYISDSALALVYEGHRVRVGVMRGYAPPFFREFASPEHRGTIELHRFDGIESIREHRYPTLPRGLLRTLTNRSLDRAIDRMVEGFLSERRPDMVLVHTEGLAPGLMSIAQREALPFIVVLHGQNTNTAYLTKGGQADRFRKSLSAADQLVIVGEPLRSYAEQLSGRTDAIETVWNGVYPPNAMRNHPMPDVAPVELIAVANLQEGKGVDLLLDGLQRLFAQGVVNWRLRIIGDGPWRDLLQAKSAAGGLGDLVRFLGIRTNSQVFEELAQADVFVLPSYREAFGVVYLEAMSTGLLTIGVEGEGPSQFIEHDVNGLLVAPQSVESIVQTLCSIVQGPRERWRAIAAAGASHARNNCTWKSHAEKMTEVIEEAIARKAK